MYSTKMENMMIWCKYALCNNYPNQINCYTNQHHTYYRLDSFKRKQVEMQSNTPGLSGLSKELHGNYFISGSERYSVGLLCSSLQLDCLRKDRSNSFFTLKSLWKRKSSRDSKSICGWQELLCCEKGWRKKTQENLRSSEIISHKLDLYIVYHTCCYTFVHNHSKPNTKTESF